jgi:hypothetical protein
MGRRIELSIFPLDLVEGMDKGEVMRRKDSERDAERPSYYSRFWLDIAAGRRVIGEPQPEETEMTEPVLPRSADSYREMRATTVVAPVEEEK